MDIDGKKFLIRQVNEIIESAINYGGDFGGAYYNERYRSELIELMENFKVCFLGDKFEVGIVGDVPMFFEKVEEKKE